MAVAAAEDALLAGDGNSSSSSSSSCERRVGAHRAALRRAEDDILQRAGVAGAQRNSSSSSSGQRRRWRRSGAVLAARIAAWAVRYPLHTATLYTQATGRAPVLGRATLRRIYAGAVGGMAYQWTTGLHLNAVGAAVACALPGEAPTLMGTAVRVALHYCTFGALYGGMRQSVAARLVAVGGGGGGTLGGLSLLRPAWAWLRDRLLLRGPRGAVLCVYVRDVVLSAVKGSLGGALARMLTSSPAIHVYVSVARAARVSRRLATRLLRAIGVPPPVAPAAASAGLPPAGIVLDAPSDMDIMFSSIESPAEVPATASETPPSLAYLDMERPAEDRRQMFKQGEFLVYTQLIGSLLGTVATRALFYPIDTVIVRLMADEAGLTRLGYAGFWSCLGRLCSAEGLSVLYAGFGFMVVSELAVSWLTAEAAHFLCKTAWAFPA